MVIGTNPFAYAVPGGEERPASDIATSVVAASKVISAKALNKYDPLGWFRFTSMGIRQRIPANIPKLVYRRHMAGHKGYGLALMIEILSAVLTGADMLSEVKLWLEENPGPLNQGHAFIAIDVNAIMPIEQFKNRMDRLIGTEQDDERSDNNMAAAKNNARIADALLR